MAKKIKFESFKYRFLIAAEHSEFVPDDSSFPVWEDFVRKLGFNYKQGGIEIDWQFARPGTLSFSLKDPVLFLRGDSEKSVARQHENDLSSSEDPVKIKNDKYFSEVVSQVARNAGYINAASTQSQIQKRIQNEREFHDSWADSEDVEAIDVRENNEVCTAPEMRFISQRLGDITGKRVLDVGCGLGEASVYFALLGADVTSSDLSQGMLNATSRLASANGVGVTQHLASAEDMCLSPEERFDVIYMGNLLHHVDIEQTILRIKPHLAPDGIFVSWDPIAYNPVINVYRSIATDVRTPDEHPLKWADIKLFHKHFSTVETRYFWLTTLAIFLFMALAQRRNPNEERYWKAVVTEGDKWAWIYKPLKVIDNALLTIFPPLRLLCWNVVIVSKL